MGQHLFNLPLEEIVFFIIDGLLVGTLALLLEENSMPAPEFLLRFTYLAMEAYIIGGVTVVLWLAHFRFLWGRRWLIFLGTVLVSAYTLPLDAWAVARGWGGFNPAYVSGIYFFGGSLLLEEIIFWLGTASVTLSAVLIFAELERRGVPRWALPAGVLLPIEWLDNLGSDSTTSIGAPTKHPIHDAKS